jgi:hypothetical protein
MNFPSSKRGCVFSFSPKSEGYNAKSEGFLGKSEGYKRLAFTFNLLIVIFLKVKVKE